MHKKIVQSVWAGVALLVFASAACAPAAAPPPAASTKAGSGSTSAAPAKEAASYAGQTVKIVVGYATGGGYDLTARLLSRHLSKHLPGNPQVIVENMEGAASKVAANYLFNTAPKDGTVIGSVNTQLVMDQATAADGVQFDAKKFNWLGSAFSSTDVCAVRSDSKTPTYKDIVAAKDPVKIGSNAPGDSTWASPVMLKATTGANFEVIAGYKGTNDLRVAAERGEIQGLCQSWESLNLSSQYLEKIIKPVVQNASRKHADLQDVPLADEFAKDAEAKRLLALIRAPREYDKPFLAPPGVPAERVAVLRAAVTAAFADPALKEEAKAGKIEISPKDGPAVEAGVNELLATPADAIKRFQEILKP